MVLPGITEPKEAIVEKTQLVAGIVILVLAALIFLFVRTGESVPVAITLTVVGVVIVATRKKKSPGYDG